MQSSDARNIIKHDKAVTDCLWFLSCGYASVTLEIIASIWTNWKKVNLYVTINNTTSKAHNYRSRKQLLLNHSYIFRPSLPYSGIKLYPWRWPIGPTTCRTASEINISMICKYILEYTVKMYYKLYIICVINKCKLQLLMYLIKHSALQIQKVHLIALIWTKCILFLCLN
jgi:hypothetical protein